MSRYTMRSPAERLLTYGIFAAAAAGHLAALILFAPPERPVSATLRPTAIAFAAAVPSAPTEAPRAVAPAPQPVPRAITVPDPVPDQLETTEEVSDAEAPVLPAEAPSEAPSIAGCVTSGSTETAATRTAGASDIDIRALVLARLEAKKVYPMAARKRGIQGLVSIIFTVLPDGSVSNVRVEESGAHVYLIQAARESLRAAAPFNTPRGSAETLEMRVVMEYRLEDS